MVLVDTSIWINHFREDNLLLEKLLLDTEVVCHPFIIGELACGKLKNRKEILSLLQSLTMIRPIDLNEFLYFIEQNQLMGIGIGFVDVHLLASAKLSEIPLWTFDTKLKSVAMKLKVAYK